jgi:LuxR family transcriptional regulator, maltose regulon positive regulatory protein
MSTARLRQRIPRPVQAELSRATLIKQLEPTEPVRLIMLCAPTGYGKSTLLGQYARSALGCLWMELSPDESDAINLHSALCKLICDAVPELELQRSKKALERNLSGDALGRALARDLDDAPQDLTLILNGGEYLSSTGRSWVMSLVEGLSEGHRVMITAYDLSEFHITRLMVSGAITVINADALCFSTEESTAFLTARGYTGDIDFAHQETAGWPAGIGLVAAGARPDLNLDDLVADAIARLDEPLRNSLPQAAVLQIWSESEAALIGCQLPTGWVETVRRAGLPLSPLGDRSYRPHPLLMETLERQLHTQPQRHSELHRRAAQLCQANGEWVAQSTHLRCIGETNGAATALIEPVQHWLTRGEFAEICDALKPFDPATLPVTLLAALGTALVEIGKVDHGVALLNTIKTTEPMVPYVFFSLGKVAARKGNIDESLSLVERGLSLETRDAGWLACQRLRGWVLMLLDRFDEAERWTLQLIQEAEAQGDLLHLGASLLVLHNIQVAANRGSDEALLLRTLAVFKDLDLPARCGILHVELARLYRIRGQFEVAEQHGVRAERCLRESSSEALAHCARERGLLERWSGNLQNALAWYAQTFREAQHHQLDQLVTLVTLEQAEVLFDLNQSIQAKELLSVVQPTDTITRLLKTTQAFLSGREHLRLGNWNLAQQELESCLPTNPITEARILALLASIAFHQGRLQPENAALLKSAWSKLGSEAVLRLDYALCHESIEHMRSQGWLPQQNIPATSQVLDPNNHSRRVLKINTFGERAVWIDDVPVRIPLTKSFELLTYLCLHGSSRLEVLLDQLWNGSRESRHHEYFRVAVRKLRGNLTDGGGLDWNPILADGAYRVSEAFKIQIDAAGIEQLDALEDGVLGAALDNLSGTFMEGLETPWINERRERSQNAVERSWLRWARFLATQHSPTALGAYDRVLRFGDFSDALVLEALTVCHNQSAQTQGQRWFETYVAQFKEEFGDLPEETFFLQARAIGFGLRTGSQQIPSHSL